MQMTQTLPNRVTVALSGELDQCSASQIRAQLDTVLCDSRVTHLVLDMEKLTFMDSSGIGVLLGRLRILQLRGGTLSVMNMKPPIAKLFRLTGMQRVIEVLDEPKGGRA